MTKRETAAERRAREAAETREAEMRWEAEKPMRLLNAIARAHSLEDSYLGVESCMSLKDKDILYCYFKFSSADIFNEYFTRVDELTENGMQAIERNITEFEDMRDRKRHLENVKESVLARLSDEEKEALGLD